MTQTLDQVANSANGHSVSHNLIQELIKEGLSTATQSSHGDDEQYRRLAHILVDNCLLAPVKTPIDPERLQHIDLTLTILRQQPTSRPRLFFGGSTPLIKWILPRLVQAATDFARLETSYDIAQKVIDCIADILNVSLTSIDGEAHPSVGETQASISWILVHCLRFVDDVLEGNPRPLFGYKLPPLPTTCVICLTIVLKSTLPWAERLRRLAVRCLIVIGHRIEQDITAQCCFVDASISCNGIYPVELLACPFPWPFSNHQAWIDCQARLAAHIDAASSHAQLSLWSTLQSRFGGTGAPDLPSWQTIGRLVSPIEEVLTAAEINHLIGHAQLQLWREQLTGAGLPPGIDSDLRKRFSSILPELSVTAGKRMRASDGPARYNDKLREQLPELVAVQSEGDIIDHALALAEAANIEPITKISSCLLDIFKEATAEGPDGQLSAKAFKLFDVVSTPQQDQTILLRSLCFLLQSTKPEEIVSRFLKSSKHRTRALVVASLSHRSRTCRAQAGRAFSLVFLAAQAGPEHLSEPSDILQSELVQELRDLFSVPDSDRPMLVATLGNMARYATPEVQGIILESLLRYLGAPSSPLRSLTYTTLLSLCKHHEKTPFSLISPHLERISIMLVGSLSESPEVLAEATSFIGQTRQNFIETTLQFTLPAMVLSRNRQVLEQMASILQKGLGLILLSNAAQILTQVFLAPDQTDRCLAFLVNLIRQIVQDASTTHIDATTLITTCTVPLLVSLVIELGDEDSTVSRNAATALRKAQSVQRNVRKGSSVDLGSFLKPHMLGVMTHLNETLHDVRGKKSPSYKRKLIRSLKTLIELVGDSIASYSPQIMASLQSTLGMTDLRRVTLTTWLAFTRTLRYSDIGPFVGRTTAALVANWAAFDDEDRKIGRSIIMEIADNARHLTSYLDDVVGLDHIPELREAAIKLTAVRKNWNFSRQLSKLLDRVKSKNVAIAITSIRELRDVLVANPKHLAALSEGDSFQPLIANTIHCLLAASSRDSEFVGFCDLAHECLGIIGALDPDRFMSASESHTMTIMSNFTDPEESIDFAIHLIRDLLVDAFRATNDTKLQGHLAYAIQELLQFCEFSPKLLQNTSNGSVSLKIRNRWMSLPKDQHETLTPLLESRFTLTDGSTTTFNHPIYPTMPTYREWIQSWTMDLISQIMASTAPDRGTRDSQAIFGVFRGVLRNQDVTVAHHILPHLVLNVLLSGGQSAREQIGKEINSVLQDQVSVVSPGSAEKRTWSAQVIFDLMDHLSKWLRLYLQRAGSSKADKATSFRAVESVISTMEVELMANAALQSRAYARALRGFEQRIIQLRRDGRGNTDLQTYFEKLHLIYANLDEPDGMEGVSTFVIAPSLEHQIREHESTGRWTSAQSCWEVRLQQSPNDVTLHQGLLHCLRNLGHYDTLRTHIRGILSVHPEWSHSLATFEAEAACIIGDWSAIRRLEQAAPPIARVLLALNDGQPMAPQLLSARRSLGESIASKSYSRMYQSVLDLHSLREVEIIHEASSKIISLQGSANQRPITQDVVGSLIRQLEHRFHTLAPSFQVREQALSIRRAAFGLTKAPELRAEIGSTWIQTAKIARKSGYEQTAYSAILQAQEVDAPYAFLQQAKLLRVHSGAWKALTDLQNMAQPIKSIGGTDYARDRSLAKVLLLEARWANESDRFDANEIIERYKEAIRLAPNLEGPYYHLGHYYDSMRSTDPGINAQYNYHTCQNYLQALQHGVKYIFQTMPRLLTLWLDLGEDKELKKTPNMGAWLKKITNMVDRSRKDLAAYQFLTAYPQIVSRIVHSDKDVGAVLIKIMSLVLERYPQQALWPTIGVMQSKRADRKAKCAAVIQRAQRNDPGVAQMIAEASRLGSALLRLSEDNTEQKKRDMVLSVHFPYVKSAVPSRMIIPLQDALSCSLPSSAEAMAGHNAFPDNPVEIHDIDDKVEVMPSLQRPKKLVLVGTNGKKYPFLCKPHDDLRKDARLMDMNAMINKLLKSASASRRRRLYIRTYAVMPLNEECGLLQWVANTRALKTILEHYYMRNGQRLYSSDISTRLAEAQRKGPHAQIKHFRDDVLKEFSPTVFHEWFLTTWPEPSAWLASRMSYSRTLAVMSMIGYVLGLGDRHGENILFDSTTGDTVHVDLNCLFEKGKSFDIPERVPFRLTQNLVDALGVTGVEGVFRKAAEIALGILRSNSDTLMSVLEAFAHDPLVEWSNRSGRAKPDKDVRATAEKNLKPIRSKLQGIMDSQAVTVPNQVDALIKEATNPNNLGLMYQGWAAWL